MIFERFIILMNVLFSDKPFDVESGIVASSDLTLHSVYCPPSASVEENRSAAPGDDCPELAIGNISLIVDTKSSPETGGMDTLLNCF